MKCAPRVYLDGRRDELSAALVNSCERNVVPASVPAGMCTRIIAPWSWPATLRTTWTAGSRLSCVRGSILRRPLRSVNTLSPDTVAADFPCSPKKNFFTQLAHSDEYVLYLRLQTLYTNSKYAPQTQRQKVHLLHFSDRVH